MDYTAPAATQASSEAESDQDSDLEEQQQQQQQQQEDGHIALDVAPLSPTPWEQNDKENAPAQDPNKQEETAEFEKAAIDLPPKVEKENEGECRVCHLPFDGEFAAGETMQLGCDCKDDLSLAHRQCAETWFKIKGNRLLARPSQEIVYTVSEIILNVSFEIPSANYGSNWTLLLISFTLSRLIDVSIFFFFLVGRRGSFYGSDRVTSVIPSLGWRRVSHR